MPRKQPEYLIFADATPRADFAAIAISDAVRAAVVAYVTERRKPGHFLSAVFSNDLEKAVAHADDTSILALRDLVRWIYNYAPRNCWGSKEKFLAWLAEPTDEALEPEKT